MMREEQSQAGRYSHQDGVLPPLEQREHPQRPVHPLLRLFERIAAQFQCVGGDADDPEQRCAVQDGKFRPGENEHRVLSFLSFNGDCSIRSHCFRAFPVPVQEGEW